MDHEDPRQAVERLTRELARERRRARQVERIAETSEQLSRQSKQALLAALAELEDTVGRLQDTTAHLEAARHEAEQASAAKSSFLATMSHEIRTPMNGVIGSICELQESSLDGSQRELVELMSRSANHLMALLNDLLDFAKIESGELVLEDSPFDPLADVRDVLATERSIAREKGLDLELLEEGPIPALVRGDEHRFRQVLHNLVHNAVKFTLNGYVRVRLARSPADPELLVIQVEDSGIGIKESALESIFDAFTQAEAGTTRIFGGTGLGLAICRRLAARMGGTITVRSTPGVGSTFTFTCRLPAADPDAGDEGEECERRLSQTSLRVLVVDDDPTNRRLAERMLQRLRHRPRVVNGGGEALDLLAREPFDAVLMDCSMPGMDGYEATALLRQREGGASPRMPVIAFTAHAMNGDRERCLAAGMDDYLVKPFSLEDLRRILTALRAAQQDQSTTTSSRDSSAA